MCVFFSARNECRIQRVVRWVRSDVQLAAKRRGASLVLAQLRTAQGRPKSQTAGLPLAAHGERQTREVLPVARVLVAGARQGTTSAGSVLRTSLRGRQPGSGRAASSWPPRTCPYRPLITKKSSRAVRGTHFFAKNEVQLFWQKLHFIFAIKC